MSYYLIENVMGFETPVAQGNRESLELKKEKRERTLTTEGVGSAAGDLLIKARYYIVPKEDWDIHNCPLIPVDFS